MQNDLKEAQARANDYHDRWQRALADFANLRRRTERDQVLMKDNAIGSVLKPFLDALDDLGMALQNAPEKGEGAAWSEGIQLIFRKVQTQLNTMGVQMMETEGEFFDPNFHEAIVQELNPNFESGQIIDVIKPGYVIGDRVLRPAQVRVAA